MRQAGRQGVTAGIRLLLLSAASCAAPIVAQPAGAAKPADAADPLVDLAMFGPADTLVFARWDGVAAKPTDTTAVLEAIGMPQPPTAVRDALLVESGAAFLLDSGAQWCVWLIAPEHSAAGALEKLKALRAPGVDARPLSIVDVAFERLGDGWHAAAIGRLVIVSSDVAATRRFAPRLRHETVTNLATVRLLEAARAAQDTWKRRGAIEFYANVEYAWMKRAGVPLLEGSNEPLLRALGIAHLRSIGGAVDFDDQEAVLDVAFVTRYQPRGVWALPRRDTSPAPETWRAGPRPSARMWAVRFDPGALRSLGEAVLKVGSLPEELRAWAEAAAAVPSDALVGEGSGWLRGDDEGTTHWLMQLPFREAYARRVAAAPSTERKWVTLTRQAARPAIAALKLESVVVADAPETVVEDDAGTRTTDSPNWKRLADQLSPAAAFALIECEEDTPARDGTPAQAKGLTAVYEQHRTTQLLRVRGARRELVAQVLTGPRVLAERWLRAADAEE